MPDSDDMVRKDDPIQIPERIIEEAATRAAEKVMAQLSIRDEAIAKRAVELAFDQVYMEIGKSVVKKLFIGIGIAATALLTWAASTGKF